MRLVFMGTPEYAAISLEALIQKGYQVVGVFTQPDKPKGRGGKVSMPPVKALALQYGIPVYQPRRIRQDGLEDLRALNPDLCVTAAYGQILSEEILAIPRLGTVNVHASLLPKYRGSSPANWVLIQGESHTGVTTMMTDRGIDTGDILLRKELPILPEENAGELTLRLARAGADLLLETLNRLEEGTCPRQQQNEAEMSYFPLLKRETGYIDWEKPAKDIVNLVRGVQPWPGAATQSPWGQLKILSARAEEGLAGTLPGYILSADAREGLLVQAGQGAVRVETLQAPGGKAMASKDFLRGHPLEQGGLMEKIEVNT